MFWEDEILKKFILITYAIVTYAIVLILILFGIVVGWSFEYIIFAIIGAFLIYAIIYIIYNSILYIIPLNRKKKMNDLGANEYIENEITEAILSAIKDGEYVSIGEDSEVFREITEKYDLMFSSLGKFDSGNIGFSDNKEPLKFIDKYVLNSPSKFVIYFSDYILYIFPEVILAFAKHYGKIGFLAAYKLEALKISFSKTIKPEKVIVYEKNKYDLQYYENYNTISDAKIISSYWLHTNKDGSRNLRFSPRNNPIIFELEYGKITVNIGAYSVKKIFSRCEDARGFAKLFNSYKSSKVKLNKVSEFDNLDECIIPELIETKNMLCKNENFWQKIRSFIRK